jgi:galactokinase
VTVRAFAPGRVNLIGDHTDTTGGLVLPMAIHLGTTVEVERRGTEVRLRSDTEDEPAVVPLDVTDPAAVSPAWARYVAGVVAEVGPAAGATGTVTTTLPVGAGLSSSAALEVAVALALGFARSPVEVALACQRAEHAASGVPSGIMDQLASAAGVAGCALLIDCTTLERTPVPVPGDVEVVVVHSGEARALAGSAYAERRSQCEAAEAEIGPLRTAALDAVVTIADPVVRRRARHVVTENARVREAAAALAAGDAVAAGAAMVASHASLRDDFEVSTPALDRLVDDLTATPGVLGARLTGAGFGGCAVALTRPGAVDRGWVVQAVDGARLLV